MPQPLDPLTWLGLAAAITAAYTAAVILSGRKIEAEAITEGEEQVEESTLPPIETLAEPQPQVKPTPAPKPQPQSTAEQPAEKKTEEKKPPPPPKPSQPPKEEKQQREAEQPEDSLPDIELLQEPEPLETMLETAESLRNELEKLAALLKEGRVN